MELGEAGHRLPPNPGKSEGGPFPKDSCVGVSETDPLENWVLRARHLRAN